MTCGELEHHLAIRNLRHSCIYVQDNNGDLKLGHCTDIGDIDNKRNGEDKVCRHEMIVICGLQ